MTDQEMAESAVRGLAKELGAPAVPLELAVELAAFIASRLKGAGFAEAISAGHVAAERVKTGTDAERSRRERMGGPT